MTNAVNNDIYVWDDNYELRVATLVCIEIVECRYGSGRTVVNHFREGNETFEQYATRVAEAGNSVEAISRKFVNVMEY